VVSAANSGWRTVEFARNDDPDFVNRRFRRFRRNFGHAFFNGWKIVHATLHNSYPSGEIEPVLPEPRRCELGLRTLMVRFSRFFSRNEIRARFSRARHRPN
jgi:hypothetical protein